VYHAGVLTWSQSGNLAVQVFFSLSGWLIGSSHAVSIGHYIYTDKRIGEIRDSVYTEKLGHAAMLTGHLLVAAGFIGHYAFFFRT